MKKMFGFALMVATMYTSMSPVAMAGTIVDAAAADENFSSLVEAVVAQDLVGALSNTHAQYTVFAPTNAAFAALPQDVKDALAEDPSLLSKILLYHVVEHEYFADRVVAAHAFPTLEGSEITISQRDGNVFVDDAQITAVNIDVTNGVIHVIDSVLVPEGLIAPKTVQKNPESAGSTIVDLAIATPELSSLVDAVVARDLVGALADESVELTVFAPTNDAFAGIPGFIARAIERQPELLTEILLYHVIGSEVKAADVVALSSATTLQGSDLAITVDAGSVFVDEANVIATDIDAVNGVVHLIDQVIVPESIVQKAQEIDITSLYRFWSEEYKSHFFTTSVQERDLIISSDAAWQYEGFQNYTATPGASEVREVYRFYSEEFGGHFYTVSESEKDGILENDTNWSLEGTGYYAYDEQQPGTVAVYRFWSDVYKSHFYTSSESERDFTQENDSNWRYEGIAWYVDESK